MSTDAITMHMAIVGASGSGKTVTAKGYAEALLTDRRHVCIIDPTGAWWGLRSNAAGDGPGFDIPIFGGAHGDVPIAVDQGEAIGAIIADGVSAVVDVSGLRTGSEQRRFVRDLLRRLRAKSDGNFHLIVDEADEFAAQKPRDDFGYEAGEELIWMAKRGRLAGFVLMLITQRPASIDKEVLTQAQTLVVHQLVAPVDQKPVLDYLRDNASTHEFRAVKTTLASLERGKRYVYSPRLAMFALGMSPALTTFDSSRTPAPGELATQPKMLAQIDLGVIRAALAPVRPASAADSKLAYEAGAAGGGLLVEKDRQIADLIRANAECAMVISDQLDQIFQMSEWAEKIVALAKEVPASGQRKAGEETAGQTEGHQAMMSATPRAKPQRQRKQPQEVTAGETATALNASARKMLDMLDQISPARVPWGSLAAMVGNKARGGSFNAARKAMRESGRIIEDGDTVRSAWLATTGLRRDKAFALWSDVLSNPAPRMMIALKEEGPLTRAALAASLGVVPRGGNFNNGVAQLLRNGVAIDRGGVLHLADPLPGESA
ncbi:DUF87 domain-containing protein [Novosphingobium sp.]|uniref:helicase HerA domain-containing protein n=1 Tax=Novosphingobium sp. TaxID=1874826 RepID=UPI002612CCB9|nr:DUF87 domain-containing protein [Novosphingobium sp.]